MISNALNQSPLSHNIHLSIHPHTPCVYILYPHEHTCFMTKACNQSFGHTILLCEWLSTWTNTLFSDCITSYRCLLFEPRVATVTHRVHPLLCSYLYRTTITHTHYIGIPVCTIHDHTHLPYYHSCFYCPRSYSRTTSSFLYAPPTIEPRTISLFLFPPPTISHTHYISSFIFPSPTIAHTNHVIIPVCTAHDRTHVSCRHLYFHRPRSHTYHIVIPVFTTHDRTHEPHCLSYLQPPRSLTRNISQNNNIDNPINRFSSTANSLEINESINATKTSNIVTISSSLMMVHDPTNFSMGATVSIIISSPQSTAIPHHLYR